MRNLLIIIGAVCYCVAPDLFFGPIDDAIVLLGSVVYTIASSIGANDSAYTIIDGEEGDF